MFDRLILELAIIALGLAVVCFAVGFFIGRATR